MIEEKTRLKESLVVFLKTLRLLIEMCENKTKVQEAAAARVEKEKEQEIKNKAEVVKDDVNNDNDVESKNESAENVDKIDSK